MMKHYKKQQGSALVLALLITVFVAALMVALINYQHISIRYTNFTHTFEKIILYVQGAEWLAKDILIEKFERHELAAQSNNTRQQRPTQQNNRSQSDNKTIDQQVEHFDSYGQDWAKAITKVGNIPLDINAVITDQQALFNINNLTALKSDEDEDEDEDDNNENNEEKSNNRKSDDNKRNTNNKEDAKQDNEEDKDEDKETVSIKIFKRLLDQLNLDEEVATIIMRNLRLPTQLAKADTDQTNQVRYRKLIDISELLLIEELPYETYLKLAPYITALPEQTKININTASAEIIMILGEDLDKQAVNEFIKLRERQEFKGFANREAFDKANISDKLDMGQISLGSSYFLLTTEVYLRGQYHTWKSWLKREKITDEYKRTSAKVTLLKRARN